jgi:hypothetical protein
VNNFLDNCAILWSVVHAITDKTLPPPLTIMFFDGSFTSKRKVDLKGSSKKDQDKQSFLEKQKQEREKRALDKQKLKGAISIQAFYRGRSSVAKSKQAERAKWDHDITTVPRTNTQAIIPLVRTLLYFYKDPTDNDRLRVLCNLILDNILQGTLSFFLYYRTNT